MAAEGVLGSLSIFKGGERTLHGCSLNTYTAGPHDPELDTEALYDMQK